jgi:hypothetical protein
MAVAGGFEVSGPSLAQKKDEAGAQGLVQKKDEPGAQA